MANLTGVRVPGQVFFGQPHQPKLLRSVDRLESFTGGQALACFHFDERERSSAAHDQINLAGAETNVAADDRVAAETIEPRGTTLAERAEFAGVETASEKLHLR